MTTPMGSDPGRTAQGSDPGRISVVLEGSDPIPSNMLKSRIVFLITVFLFASPRPLFAEPLASAAQSSAPAAQAPDSAVEAYRIGVEDVLDISVLQPDPLAATVTVSPDGSVSFPLIGGVRIKGLTTEEAQHEIERRLADGYMKYPVVSVSLRESRSRKFFVYGEVIKPGAYPMEEHATVLKAISIAGGFTKFGSSSHVKILRQQPNQPGYETIPINIKAVMDGNAQQDVLLQDGDMVVVSEGVF